MDWTATHSYLDREYIEQCDNCGCKFKVRVFKQAGHNDIEEFYCPDCRKEFRTRTCNTPEVYKIPDEANKNLKNMRLGGK